MLYAATTKRTETGRQAGSNHYHFLRRPHGKISWNQEHRRQGRTKISLVILCTVQTPFRLVNKTKLLLPGNEEVTYAIARSKRQVEIAKRDNGWKNWNKMRSNPKTDNLLHLSICLSQQTYWEISLQTTSSKTNPFADSHHDPDCTMHRQPL